MAAEGSPHWTLCAPPRRQVGLLRTSRPISSCSLIRSGRVTTEIGSGARGAALHIFQKRRVGVSTATWSSGFSHLGQSQPFCKKHAGGGGFVLTPTHPPLHPPTH